MVLLSVSVIAAVEPLPAGLLIPPATALVQEKAAVVLELVAVYVLEILLHQLAVAELVITDVGLTVTATSKVVPEQPFTLGVIR